MGRRLAGLLRSRAGGIIYLCGPLGAGKTTLVRALLRALGVSGSVRSPTYTLLEPYETPAARVIHLDLYRLTGPDELEPLGLDAYPPETHWWLIEWPERGGERLPAPTVTVELALLPVGRQLRLSGAQEALSLWLPRSKSGVA